MKQLELENPIINNKSSKINILIADDDPNFRHLITHYLSKDGYSFQEVIDGQTAYDELCRDIYDVCILDINMPIKSGLNTLKKIKEQGTVSTYIIIMTGYDDNLTIINAMRMGADDYILKPFNLDELKLAITRGIKTRNIKLENIKYKNHLETEIQKQTAKLQKAYLDIVNAFANTIELRDPYTGGHSKRVSEIAYVIGEEINFNNLELERLKIGGLLHDIGKIGISDNILKKPAKLNAEEFNEIKRHPQQGYDIVKSITSIKEILPCIISHHEKYDGTGYPNGLKRTKIPIEGRILGVADAFEAMTSHRPYRRALAWKQAYNEIIKYSGSQFDPEIVKLFKKLWKKHKIQDILLKYQHNILKAL